MPEERPVRRDVGPCPGAAAGWLLPDVVDGGVGPVPVLKDGVHTKLARVAA